MKLISLVIFTVFMLPLKAALAEDNAMQKPAPRTQIDVTAEINNLQKLLSRQLPQISRSKIRATPVAGVYEVVSGSSVMYVSSDARYIFDGDLIDLKERRNLTENMRGEGRKQMMDALGESNMLVYTPKIDSKHTITVFTDIYCPYCRKLHDEMNQYMAAGVKVRYLFLPFKGKKSYDDSVSVWCADNPQQALDKAKAGQPIVAKVCEHPIDKHKQLATALEIRGTPAIVFENGTMSPGYVPAAKVIEQLNKSANL